MSCRGSSISHRTIRIHQHYWNKLRILLSFSVRNFSHLPAPWLVWLCCGLVGQWSMAIGNMKYRSNKTPSHERRTSIPHVTSWHMTHQDTSRIRLWLVRWMSGNTMTIHKEKDHTIEVWSEVWLSGMGVRRRPCCLGRLNVWTSERLNVWTLNVDVWTIWSEFCFLLIIAGSQQQSHCRIGDCQSPTVL